MLSKKTALHPLHLAAGAKMVEFAGYDMPVQYHGIMAEHLHTRAAAGLFDVSHMGQLRVSGVDVIAELEAVLPIDLGALDVGQAAYTFLPNATGGIIDDLIVTRLSEQEYNLVLNAACKHDDLAYLQTNLNTSELKLLTNWSLLALQGPQASAVLSRCIPGIANLEFMRCRSINWKVNGTDSDAVECLISRSGYTGEDGFEIAIPNSAATVIAEQILSHDEVEWIGLGARDSLRMEAGLCLYGHDISNDITPIEAGLGWSISASRRVSGTKPAGFPGADIILSQQREKIEKRWRGRVRVGLSVEGKAPVREGAGIFCANGDGEKIGEVTSGGYAPSLQRPIAMGYVSSGYSVIGTSVVAMVRGKPRELVVCELPFLVKNYFKR